MISRDPTLKTVVRLADDRTISALDIQHEYLAAAGKRFQGRDTETDWALTTWGTVLADLERDPMLCSDRLDWVAKKWLLETLRDAEHLAWCDPWLQAIDLEYHNVRRDEGLYAELMRENKMLRYVTEEQVRRAIRQPPSDTRAYFRGRCIEKFARHITSVQWDELAFDRGDHDAVVPLLNVFDDDSVRRYNEAIDKAADVGRLLQDIDHERRQR